MNITFYNISLFLLGITTFYLANDRVKSSVSLWIYFSCVMVAVLYIYKFLGANSMFSKSTLI